MSATTPAISSLIQALIALIPENPSPRALDEAYLAQAADAQDLEFRQRELEQRDNDAAQCLTLGLGLR
jgi:hypothetical protein